LILAALRPLPFVLGWLCSVTGCQYVSGVSDLRVQEGASDQPNWSCRNHPRNGDASAKVKYSQPIRNLADDSIIEDVSVKICSNTDTDCTAPIVETTPVDGIVAFTLDASFTGYIELSSPRMMPAIVELTRPVGKMRLLPELRMVTPSMFQLFSRLVGVTPDPLLGYAQFWAYDCDAERASGVQVRVMDEHAASAKNYYVMDGKLPSLAADQTDEYGASGFVNLPPGVLTFRATNAQDDTVITQFAARVRPGQITCAVIEPD
jgi:hypothetical protein